MSSHKLPGNPPVALVLRRSARARRISLRVSRLDGRVTLTLPNGVPESEAVAFAESKSDWIRGHLDQRPQQHLVDIGSQIPIEGRLRHVVEGSSPRLCSSLGDAETLFRGPLLETSAWGPHVYKLGNSLRTEREQKPCRTESTSKPSATSLVRNTATLSSALTPGPATATTIAPSSTPTAAQTTAPTDTPQLLRRQHR